MLGKPVMAIWDRERLPAHARADLWFGAYKSPIRWWDIELKKPSARLADATMASNYKLCRTARQRGQLTQARAPVPCAPQSTFSAPELPSLEKGPMHRSLKTNNLLNRSVVGIGLTPDIVAALGAIRDVRMLCWPIAWGKWGESTIPRGGCRPECCDGASCPNAAR